MSRIPKVCYDFDGTLVTHSWPEWGTWQQGAIEHLQAIHRAGVYSFVTSCRLHPNLFQSDIPRSPEVVFAEEQEMRRRLDDAGLSFVNIYNDKGKPYADVYVDDKALWYPGRPKSWDKMTDVILARLGR